MHTGVRSLPELLAQVWLLVATAVAEAFRRLAYVAQAGMQQQ